MAIDKSSTPATGARGRRQFPDGFHHDAQQELMRGATPVTTRPFMPSSSPVRRSTSSVRNAHRHHMANRSNPNANYYEILADEADETTETLDAIDLESETRKIIAKEKERMTTRADVLRTFAESIAGCAREFDHGYAHAVANDFARSLLHHWNQFLHAGDTTGYSNDLPQMKLPVRQKPVAKPPTNEQMPYQKSVSFANVAKEAARQAPGDIHIAPTRRQPIAASNYTDRRILLRLKEGSNFFEKEPYQIRSAIFEKLKLGAQDVQNITRIPTGWSVVARNQEIQEKILESQGQWGPNVDLIVAEKQVTWFTYLIKDFPNELRSYDDTILDFSTTISDEIVAQTGQVPVQWRRSSKPSIDQTKTTLIISFEKPVRDKFRLFGLGAYSFLMTKPKRLVQCQNCWQFHPPVQCTATKTCKTCGVSDNEHDTENCQTTPRCANCLGPHHANYEQCYARPKKVGDTYHKLSKPQKIHARKLGAEDYSRQNIERTTEAGNKVAAEHDKGAATDDIDEADTEMADTEMADTGTNDMTAPTLDDHPCAVGGDEDMENIEEELPHGNEGAMEEDTDAEVMEDAPNNQEQADEGHATEEIDHAEEDEDNEVEETNNDDDDEDDENDSGDEDNNDTDEQEDVGESQHHRKQTADIPQTVNHQVIGFRPRALGTKAPRKELVNISMPLKKRYINTRTAQQIIPSETTNPSSDPVVGDAILARVSPHHSPPSSPPQEVRRQDQSPKRRRMMTRSRNEEET